MLDPTTRIKNLSIAIEALSRVQGMDAYFSQVCVLMQSAIDQQQEREKPKTAPTTLDDDIPF